MDHSAHVGLWCQLIYSLEQKKKVHRSVGAVIIIIFLHIVHKALNGMLPREIVPPASQASPTLRGWRCD